MIESVVEAIDELNNSAQGDCDNDFSNQGLVNGEYKIHKPEFIGLDNCLQW